MDLFDRPHHRTAATTTATTTSSTPSELFICFTSRLSSSSSMKFSKSILSPGRARDAPLSLSTSLSRRLRTNGSIKGGQASPMFPSTTKKRGAGYENPEPSSPKVTCIGQVRVKTKKKKAKQTRSLSKRRNGSGEVSFRKLEQASEAFNQTDDRLSLRYSQGNSSVHYQQQECVSHRNQRWVHLPLTICEALRAFGAEFSCLFPCRSSCFSTNEREKEEKGEAYRDGQNEEHRSCGAVFARWLVALQDGCEGGGNRRDIELVVAEEERSEAEEPRHSSTMRRSSRRHHVFEDIEFKDDEIVELEKGRVSICIPPKNALLLMRCRSDPMKMAALTSRFRESSVPKDEIDDVEGQEEEEEIDKEEHFGENKDVEVIHTQKCELSSNEVEVPADEHGVSVVDLDEIKVNPETTEVDMEMEVESQKLEAKEEETCELAAEVEQQEIKIESLTEIEQGNINLVSLAAEMDEFLEESAAQYVNQTTEDNQLQYNQGEMTIQSRSSSSGNSDTSEEATLEEEEEKFKSAVTKEIQETVLLMGGIKKIPILIQQEETTPITEPEKIEVENKELNQFEAENTKEPENEEKESVLPECLLLMMCEPKLSMEVSKETWVCRRDFLRWLPERKQVKPQAPPKKEVVLEQEQPKRRRSTDSRPPTDHRNKHLLQPPRSSCSLPAASMATMIEQKLVNAVAYEPFVLTRCKSEPMRTAAAKLTPESCFWKNRKIEPHRSAGVGAAGVGF